MVDPIGGYFVVKPKAKWGQWFTTEVIFSMEGEDVDDDDDDDVQQYQSILSRCSFLFLLWPVQ